MTARSRSRPSSSGMIIGIRSSWRRPRPALRRRPARRPGRPAGAPGCRQRSLRPGRSAVHPHRDQRRIVTTGAARSRRRWPLHQPAPVTGPGRWCSAPVTTRQIVAFGGGPASGRVARTAGTGFQHALGTSAAHPAIAANDREPAATARRPGPAPPPPDDPGPGPAARRPPGKQFSRPGAGACAEAGRRHRADCPQPHPRSGISAARPAPGGHRHWHNRTRRAPAVGVCRKTPRVTGASPHAMISTPGRRQIVTERHVTSSGNGQRRSPGRPPPAWLRAHPAAAGISHRAGPVRPGRPVRHPGPACQAAEGSAQSRALVLPPMDNPAMPEAGARRFIADRYGDRASGLALLGAGEWSRAYAFTLDGQAAVARFVGCETSNMMLPGPGEAART